MPLIFNFTGGSGGGATITSGTLAGLPGTAGQTAGNLYLTTDSPTWFEFNGTIWQPYGPMYAFTKPPATASLTWLNQGTASASDRNDSLVFFPGTNASFNIRGQYQALPAGTSWTKTLAFYQNGNGNGNSVRIGLLLFESATGKIEIFGPGNTGASAQQLFLTAASNSTTFSSDHVSQAFNQVGAICWLQISRSGTNLTYSISSDGASETFVTVVTQTITTDFTTAPDNYGFALTNQGSQNIIMRVVHLT